jgi:hypothetical protein
MTALRQVLPIEPVAHWITRIGLVMEAAPVTFDIEPIRR